MKITEETKIGDIIKEYPFLVDEAIAYNKSFEILKNPLTLMMVKNMRVGDACKTFNISFEKALNKVNAIIDKHKEGTV